MATTLVPLLSNVVKVLLRCVRSAVFATSDVNTQGATAEVHHPLWARAMQTIHARASSMATKPRYVAAALPLICTALAASPEETLLSHWNAAFELCMNKMKESPGLAFRGFGRPEC